MDLTEQRGFKAMGGKQRNKKNSSKDLVFLPYIKRNMGGFKKEKGLINADNSVGTAMGVRRVEVKEGLREINSNEKYNKDLFKKKNKKIKNKTTI